MSETDVIFKLSPDAQKKAAFIAKEFSQLNIGGDSKTLWLVDEETGDYEWSAFSLGINKEGKIEYATDSGCSCYGSWESGKEGKLIDLDAEVRLEHQYDFNTKELTDAAAEFVKEIAKVYKTFKDPQHLTAEEILNTSNMELRRAIIEKIGYERFIEIADPKTIDSDPLHGDLLRVPIKEDEDITLLHVKDPSTAREYYLRVPPTSKTAKGARAWTFGIKSSEFELVRET